MAREHCNHGYPYSTKRECAQANPGMDAVRCDRCRGYHPKAKRGKSRRGKTQH